MSDLQTFGVSLPSGDVLKLDALARHNQVSRAVIVRWAVSRYLCDADQSLFLSVRPSAKTDSLDDEQPARHE